MGKSENRLAPAGIPNPDRPARSPVIVPTEFHNKLNSLSFLSAILYIFIKAILSGFFILYYFL
jgi:hypothetical protein